MDNQVYVILIAFCILQVFTILFSAFEKVCFPHLSLRILIAFNQILPFGACIFLYIAMVMAGTGYNNG
jgi:hypothetical protein